MLWISGKTDGHRQGELAAPDGAVIPYREWWRPEARGVVLYLHGQGDHSGPFTAMGDRLHELGFSVYAHDHRGFGLSQEPRGDIRTYDIFVDDALRMVEHARVQNGGAPVFLLGLSMGGHLTLRTAAKAGREIAGAVALSPGFKLRTAPPWSAVLRAGLYFLIDPTRYMPAVHADVITTRNQTHLDRAMHDEHWVTSYTARFYVETVRSIKRAWREVPRIQAPVLILQAEQDYVICPEESQRFFERIGHPDKEFRLLEGLYHNLVAEPEMPSIATEVAAWMSERAKLRLV